MKYLVVLTALILNACQTANLLPSSDRQHVVKVDTKLKKEEAFSRLQTHFAKSTGKDAVRLADRQSGNIVLQANVPCPVLKLGNGFADGENLWFVLDVKIKDKAVVMEYTGLVVRAIANAWDSGSRPSTQAELDKVVGECLAPLQQSIASVIE